MVKVFRLPSRRRVRPQAPPPISLEEQGAKIAEMEAASVERAKARMKLRRDAREARRLAAAETDFSFEVVDGVVVAKALDGTRTRARWRKREDGTGEQVDWDADG